jgi:AcrR family transcriptional regulator
MIDRRALLIQAGLDILAEEGLAGFTQARVAARVELKQGHLTYYFPTRTDLLAAVARVAVERQLAAVAATVGGLTTPDQAVAVIATVLRRHENSRMLMALAQGADQEPEVRALFNELTNGFVTQLAALLARLGLPHAEAHADLLHALIVGLSVIDLGTSRPRGAARTQAVLAATFNALEDRQ